MEFITTGNRIAVENFFIGKVYTIVWATGNYKSLACVGKGSDFVMFQDQAPDLLFCLTMETAITVESIEEGGSAGTMNYNELENKPSINGIVLVGNKTGADLNLVSQADLDDYATNASLVAGLATKQDALSSSQLAAVNSGITSALVTQIGTNQNNILACKEFTDNASIDSDRKLYISATEPINPSLNSTWINGATIKSADSNPLNLAPDMSNWTYGYYSSGGSYDNSHPNGEKTTNNYITVTGGEQYTYSCFGGFPATTWCAINTFDSSYNFIARLAYTNSSGTTVTLGNNVAYIKLSFRTYDINNLIPVFNQGSTAVAYYIWQ